MKQVTVLMVILSLVVLLPLATSAAEVQWDSHKSGMARGKQEGKKIFINFYADW